MSAIQILPYASVPDVVEVDEYVNGARREGAYYGITQFMYKVANGVSIALVSAVLGAFGYIESTDGSLIQQPDSALLAVRIVLGALPGTIFLISIIFSRRANLSRERFADIKAKLAERKAQALSEVGQVEAAAEDAGNIQEVSAAADGMTQEQNI